jgi:hypothetical protein
MDFKKDRVHKDYLEMMATLDRIRELGIVAGTNILAKIQKKIFKAGLCVIPQSGLSFTKVLLDNTVERRPTRLQSPSYPRMRSAPRYRTSIVMAKK